MNTKKTGLAAVATGMLLLLSPLARAGLTLTPGGSLYIDGDSTLHTFQSTATQITVDFDLAEGAAALPAALKDGKVKGMTVTIPVAGMRSGEKGLDKNMRKALKADKNPDIVYALGKYELAKGADDALTAKATGDLTIAGETKPVSMEVVFRFGPKGVRMQGSYKLLMSDFGVKPPTLMFGAIKVRDPVVVRFDLLLNADEHNAKSN
jgi:polyisoprenoid-binding protein YceI